MWKLAFRKQGRESLCHTCPEFPSTTKNFMSLFPVLGTAMRDGVRENCHRSGAQGMNGNFGGGKQAAAAAFF